MTVKSSASSLAQSHEKESTTTTTTNTKDLLEHRISTATIVEISDQGSPCSNANAIKNDDENYKHFSAAGEHFARKKSEGEHTTLFHRLAARRVGHPEGRDELQEGEQEERMDDEEAPAEDQYKHLSAAGEHFAKKKAEKRSFKSLEKMEKKDTMDNQSSEIGEEDSYRNLSAAGEHFAKKKADKKSFKALQEKEVVDEEESAESKSSFENGSTESDNEADPYKHLSAAGEHFARRKSDGESLPSLFRRMSSSIAGWSNSTATED